MNQATQTFKVTFLSLDFIYYVVLFIPSILGGFLIPNLLGYTSFSVVHIAPYLIVLIYLIGFLLTVRTHKIILRTGRIQLKSKNDIYYKQNLMSHQKILGIDFCKKLKTKEVKNILIFLKNTNEIEMPIIIYIQET